MPQFQFLAPLDRAIAPLNWNKYALGTALADDMLSLVARNPGLTGGHFAADEIGRQFREVVAFVASPQRSSMAAF